LDGDVTEEAYRRYFPLIRAKCARMLGDRHEAEDVAQETFVRLWQEGMQGAAAEVVTAWVYRTATRLAIDRMRRLRVRQSAPVDPGGGSPGPDAAVGARSELLRIAGAVPDDELAVAILTRHDGLGQQEAAEIVRVSERTVRRLLRSFDLHLAMLQEDHP
jgi:RNA polymerase sigma-70 factor (ECF subfamily)